MNRLKRNVSSLKLLRGAKPSLRQTSQDVFVDVLINSLALRQELYVDNSMDIKISDQHHLGFELELSRLFGSL